MTKYAQHFDRKGSCFLPRKRISAAIKRMTQFGWTLDRPEPILVDTDEKVQALRKKMMSCDLLAIDTETTGLDILKDTVVYWSISTGDDRYFLFRDQLPLFEDILSDPGYAWIGSQMKYDAHMLKNSGYPLAGDLMCTLTMDRLIYPGRRHGLKECYMREFNEYMATFAQTFDVIKKKGAFQLKKGTALFDAFQQKYGVVPKDIPLHEILLEKYNLEPEPVIDYASLDAWTVFRLFKRLKEYLEQTETARGYTLWDVFLWCEVPFTRVLFNMERRGVLIDQQYLGNMIPRIEGELEEMEKALNRAAGYPINVNSPAQLVGFFYSSPEEGGLGLKPVKMTKGGKSGVKKPSLDKEAMTKHVEDGVEEAKTIVKYRKMSKLLSSFVKSLLKFTDAEGRVHATQQQHVVETGRLSVTNPPLQTLPRPTKDLDIRTSVIAPPGYKLIVSDYDQVEMFALAHFSGDEGMIKNIYAGRDIHTSNVELVWGEPYDEVVAAKKCKGELTERQEYLLECRQDIKTVGFGLNYGKAANRLSIDLGYLDKVREEHPDWNDRRCKWLAKQMAQDLIDKYFNQIPGARDFIQGTYRIAADTKYVETYLGRRRYLPEIMDWDEQMEELAAAQAKGRDLCWCTQCKQSRDADRETVNTILQGTAADIILLAMIRCDTDQELKQLGCRLLLQVHDELVFECPEENVVRAIEIIQYHMEHPGVRLKVPLRAEPGYGDNWAEAKN